MIRINSFGPFFWAKELPLMTESGELRKGALDDQRWLTTSWFVEDQEPFRRSTWAFRVKLNSFEAVHIGLCRVAEEDERPHRLLDQSPTDIRNWQRPDKINEIGIVTDPDQVDITDLDTQEIPVVVAGGDDGVQEEAANR